MNLKACNGITTQRLTGSYFRAVSVTRLNQPFDLDPRHTRSIRSRFNPGPLIAPVDQFRILYMSEDYNTAAAEFGALLAHRNGLIAAPGYSWAILSVNVVLQKVVDLTDWKIIQTLETSFQELTGDWFQYDGSFSTTSLPAPTQYLGQALSEAGVEGFLTYSAKRPTTRNLVVLPGNGLKGSSVKFFNNAIPFFEVPMG